MVITPETVATYAPWGNAQLAFEVGSSNITDDPLTGNPVEGVEVLEYLAAVIIEAPNWQAQPGVDTTTYSCRGRLLTPTTFDARITNGCQARAIFNGVVGRFELTFDLAMDSFHRQDLKQSFQGTFRLTGGT